MKTTHSKIILLSFLFFSFSVIHAIGQELNCQVFIENTDRISNSDPGIFEDMRRAFSDFLNKQKWTDDPFQNEEKIDCRLTISISAMPSPTEFEASVQIVSSRPIYQTSYSSLLFNFADRDWKFTYTVSQPLDFNENRFTNNITSMLAYYAYIIIGMDYDSFGKLAGTPYFEKARDVVTNAQQTPLPGWRQFDGNRNRFWLTENLLSSQFKAVREGIYEYHRLGLDVMLQNPDSCRSTVFEVVKKLKNANNVRPNSILVISFFDAKADELVDIFSQGELAFRREVFNLLNEVDPKNVEKYQGILQN